MEKNRTLNQSPSIFDAPQGLNRSFGFRKRHVTSNLLQNEKSGATVVYRKRRITKHNVLQSICSHFVSEIK